ncbi:MAG: PTPA-CTERM sorting domain-containing protein [Leptolyngbyaceae cyanobacterium SM2_5_2]|nr:PTPA-CTERM sorting domain-containing protein [Leptolyngbyaceae cyanobacterium SM2_5_2]
MSTKVVINSSISGALSIVTLVWIGAPAQAFSFTGTASGQFGLPVATGFGADVALSHESGGTNNRLTWGVPISESFSNFVQFDGEGSFSASVDSIFKVGNLTYRNGTTLASTGFDGDFPLSIQLSFTNPSGINESFSYLFNILNTDNSTGDPVLDGDVLRFSAAGLSNSSFTVGSTSYTLTLLGFAADDGATLINQFNSPEGATATAGLYGKITAVPVEPPAPIPTPALLPSLVTMGVAALRRRSQQKSR